VNNSPSQPLDERQVRQDIVEIGRRFWQQGWVAANDGNISVRLSDTELICTPSGLAKGFLSPDQLIKTDMNGQVLDGYLKPSSELTMHLECYRQRPDIGACVHAHPPTATGFACAGLSLENCVLPEVILALGGIPLTPYGTPGGTDIPAAIRPYLDNYDSFLLANHGVLAVGKNVFDAYYKMETTEHFAKISLTARLLGGEKPIAPPQVEELYQARERYGVSKQTRCVYCGEEHEGACTVPPSASPAGSDHQKAAPASTDDGPPPGTEIQRIIEEVTRQVRARLGG